MTTEADDAARRAEAQRLKEAEKQANHARFEKDVEAMLKPLPATMDHGSLVAEHQRLRMKIMEMQGLVIKGRFDFKLAQDYERKIVGQIHLVEERASGAPAGTAQKDRPGPPE